ncbi:hypothetical protein FRC17_006257 [Serendipita sp. 399]|nr:hypothetical protein FRC17_006257 [Serendipita sp. 399]
MSLKVNYIELHKQVDDLRSRVRELEEALAASQSSRHPAEHSSQGSHSSARKNALNSADNPEEHSLPMEFDALMVSPTGMQQWLGSTALSEWFVKPEKDKLPEAAALYKPTNITMMHGEPMAFSPNSLSQDQLAEYRRTAIAALPDPDTFHRIVSIYYEQVAWLYNPVPRTRLMEIAHPLLYGTPDHINAHEISTVHSILALGYLFDLSKPPGSPEVYKHASMSKFSISLECIFARTTVSTIEAYLLRLIFLLFDRDRAAPMQVYGHLGIVWRLIVSIGMHRDPARWHFDNAECQRRRRIFWDFVAFDTWQCMSWGRPSSVTSNVYDCRVPWLDENDVEGEEQRFQRWRFIFVRDILLDVLAHCTTCGATPTIGTVMKLDKRIRDYQLFGMSSQPQADSTQPVQATVYQRNIMFCIKESVICFLHRPFFVSALNENLRDPLRSRFAGSCLALHASATALLGRGHALLDYQPHVSRFFVWWGQAFTSIVALGALVIKAPGSTLAPSSLSEILIAEKAFERAAEGFKASRLLPSIRKLRERAQAAIDDYNSGRYPPALQDTADVLPGIIHGPTLIPSAIFPAPLECPVDTTSCSTETTPPVSQPESVDALVAGYLQTLQSELDQMAKQHAASRPEVQETNNPTATSQDVQNLFGFYMPPSTTLLPSAPPLLSDAQTTPAFSSATWAEFMASFGVTFE